MLSILTLACLSYVACGGEYPAEASCLVGRREAFIFALHGCPGMLEHIADSASDIVFS